jgi:hypothetical protein
MRPLPQGGQGWRKGGDYFFEAGFLQSKFFIIVEPDEFTGAATGIFLQKQSPLLSTRSYVYKSCRKHNNKHWFTGGEMEMDISFLKVLIDPNTFFQEIIQEKENLKIPALIVLFSAVTGAAAAYLMVIPTVKMMSSMMSGMDTVILAGAVIATLVMTFISWLVYTGVFYLISFVFKGEGVFNRTLEVVGFGFLPQILGNVITLIVALEYIPRVVVQPIPAGTTDSQVILDAATGLAHDPAMMEFTQIMTLVSVIFLLWSANIWIFGLQHSRQVSARDAALCVGVPVVLYAFYTIYKIGVM